MRKSLLSLIMLLVCVSMQAKQSDSAAASDLLGTWNGTWEGAGSTGGFELTLEKDVDEAKRVFEQIAEAGVDYDDVTDTLEREGVQKFIDPFAELFEGLEAKRGQLAPA